MLASSAVRRRWRVLAPSLLVVLALPASASAADPLSAARGFTVFSAGDATVTANENDGSMAAGGDLVLPSSGDYRVGNNAASAFTAAGTTAPTALYVGGTVRFGGGRLTVNGGQYARIVNATGSTGSRSGATASIAPSRGAGSISINTGQATGTMFGAPSNAIDFASAFAALRAEADEYASYDNDVTARNAGGGWLDWSAATVNPYLSLTGGTNVWRLSADQLRRLGTVTFRSMPADATLLVVVPNWTTGSWKAPNFSGAARADQILLDFPTATSLTLTADSATVAGSILAPRAAVSLQTRSNVAGQVVAATFSHTGSGEIHHVAFRGKCGPHPTPVKTPTPTPTPVKTPTPTPTKTPVPVATPTPTPTPTATPTTTPEPTPTPTPEPEATPIVSAPDIRPASDPSRVPDQVEVLAATQTAVKATARISGLAGCVKATSTVKVTGSAIAKVTFAVDGRKRKTVNGASAKLKLKAGTHKVTATVTFTNGAKPRTLTARVRRCATAAPRFTG
jgi:choice-of-anchor A domain-containing protein